MANSQHNQEEEGVNVCCMSLQLTAMTFIIEYPKARRDGRMVDEDYVAVSAEKNSLRARRQACPTACGVKTT